MESTASASLNLSQVSFLVADPSAHYLEIICNFLSSFGAEVIYRVSTAESAENLLAKGKVDAFLCAMELPGGGMELVRKIRMQEEHPSRSIPIIMLAGAPFRRLVGKARDCGASFTLVKPTSPAVLFNRLHWVATTDRPFVSVDDYYGPDRRFHEGGDHHGYQRRSTDAISAADKAQAEVDDQFLKGDQQGKTT